MYADNVLLYLTKPETTIPYLNDIILSYGYFSGYKLNVDKTMAMSIGGNVSDTSKLQRGFKWPVDGIKYLGIHIPPSLE